MQSAHAHVLFSFAENMPCVILESLCCGKPVISSNVGGVGEVVTSDNGILVEPGNEAQLSEAMQRVINNPAQWDNNTIAQKAQQQFSYESVGNQFADLYEKYSGSA